MKFLIIILCLLGAHITAQVQPVFVFEGQRMQLLDMYTPDRSIWHTDSITTMDDERVKLFKSYFRPASYSVYKTYFLPGEWPNITENEYIQWQHTISIKKLHLENIIQVKDSRNQEYLIFQYLMDGPAYAVFQSAEFKRTSEGWKHVNIQNDIASGALMQIGSIEIPFLQQLISESAAAINIDFIPSAKTRSFKEKFNRKEVFDKIETLLIQKGVSRVDINLSRTYFEYKDDGAFIESICQTYHIDDITLMEEINQATGIQLYNISKSQND